MSVESTIKSMRTPKKAELKEEAVVPVAVAEDYPGSGKNREAEPTAQGSSIRAKFDILDKASGAGRNNKSASPLEPKVAAFEAKPMAQGSSTSDVPKEDLGSEEDGKKASEKMSEVPDGNMPKGKGAGAAKGFTTVKDPTAVVGKTSSTDHQGKERTGPETVESTDIDASKKNLEADVKNLFASEEDLSEEFKAKALSLFEAVVAARVATQVAELEDSLAEEALKIVEEKEAELVEKLDAYLNTIAEEWLSTNEVPVTESIRSEVSEDFIEGMKILFKEHYIEIPEEKVDVIKDMEEHIAELEDALAEQTQIADAIAEDLIASKKETIISEMSTGLAATEVEKLRTALSAVTYEDDASYTEKIGIIKENYFSKSSKKSEILDEEAVPVKKETTDRMDRYVKAASSMTGKSAF